MQRPQVRFFIEDGKKDRDIRRRSISCNPLLAERRCFSDRFHHAFRFGSSSRYAVVSFNQTNIRLHSDLKSFSHEVHTNKACVSERFV